MRKSLIITLLLQGCFAATIGAATLQPSERELTTLLGAIDLVFEDSFAHARQIVASLNDTIPGRPIYHLLNASIAHAEMLDSEDFSNEKAFMRDVDAAIKALNNWLDNNPRDPWGYFLLGSAYGYKAVWQGQKGSWLKSMLTGLKAKGKFYDALNADPRFYDAYTGIGSYHYWASVRLRKYLPFLADNRKDGLAELQLAADSSLISSKAATVGLAWALINERKYNDALKLASDLKERTHAGRASLWVLAAVYWNNGNLRRAAEQYGELIASLERVGSQNYYNVIYCRYRRAHCLYNLGNHKAAKEEFEKILTYNPPKEIRRKHEKTYQKTKEYLANIEKAGK